MLENFFEIFNGFFSDAKRTRDLGLRLILLIILGVFIDNVFGFSEYYSMERKVILIEKYSNQIASDSTLSTQDKMELKSLRKRIIERKPWISILHGMVKKTADPTVSNKHKSKKGILTRSFSIHFITSSWVLIILMITLPVAGLFNSKLPLSQSIEVIIILEVSLFMSAWLLTDALWSIPLIDNNPSLNYLVNVLVGSLCIIPIQYWYKNRRE